MAQIKVNGTRYEASLMGNNPDRGWDGRHSVSVRLALPYSSVIALLPGNAVWSLVQTEEDGTETERDMSEFCVSGDVTDHRDGSCSIKMGKLTELEETLALLLGGEGK